MKECSVSQRITLELPIPPMLNHYWRHIVIGGRPRTLISSAGRTYKKDVTNCVSLEKKALNIRNRVKVTATIYPPDRRKRDIDGYLKALLDALTEAQVWEDDELIDELIVRRGEVVKGGKAIVRIETI